MFDNHLFSPRWLLGAHFSVSEPRVLLVGQLLPLHMHACSVCILLSIHPSQMKTTIVKIMMMRASLNKNEKKYACPTPISYLDWFNTQECVRVWVGGCMRAWTKSDRQSIGDIDIAIETCLKINFEQEIVRLPSLIGKMCPNGPETD